MATAAKAEERKMSLKNRISAKASDAASKWPKEAQERSAKRGALQHARRVSLLVLRELDNQQLSQTALADKMGVSRQQVTKIVKGQENFTFETVAKLEEALGISILNIDLQEMPAHLRMPAPETAWQKVGYEAELNVSGIKRRLKDLSQLSQKLGPEPPDVVPAPLPALSEIELKTLQHLQSAQEFAAFEGPSRVFRMDNLRRHDWQSRMLDVFNKLQEQPLGDFVIIGSADQSAPMPHGPQVPQPAQHTATKRTH